MDRLDGDLAEFAGGLGEWRGVVVGTVNELRAVAVPSNAVIIKLLFVGGGTVLRSNGGVAGEGEGRYIRRYRRLAKSRGTGQGGRAGGLVLMALGAGALEPPQGRSWTESGKVDIDAKDSKRTRRVGPGA